MLSHIFDDHKEVKGLSLGVYHLAKNTNIDLHYKEVGTSFLALNIINEF